MSDGRFKELFIRHKANPIIQAKDIPYLANSVFNAGATLIGEDTLLLMRVEDRRGISHLTAARSRDGVTGWRIDPEPTLLPSPEDHPEEIWGIEDPRVTCLQTLDSWAVVYTAYSRGGPLVSLATTTDFKTFERHGVVMPPEDKDSALFPVQFKGRWAMLHRPVPGYHSVGMHIWISFSPDLKHWGDHQILLPARKGGWWDANKIGLSPPPLPTDKGWLILYHGVRNTPGGCIYRLGLALLYYQVLTSSLFYIKDTKDIEITGLKRLQPELILKLAKLGPGTNLLALKPFQAERALETHPWIARASLTRNWPQRVHIHIQEREPTALVQLGELYYVDHRGRLFKPLSPGDPHDFPIITVLPREFFSPNEGALPETMTRITKLMDLLKKTPPPLNLENVSEIHVDLERGFTLYANGLGAGVDLGRDHYQEKLQRLALAWPVLTKRGYLPRTARISLDYPQKVLLTLKGTEEIE